MNKFVKGIICIALLVMMVLSIASCDKFFGGSQCEHEYGDWGKSNATCKSEGTQTRVCKLCKKEQTRKNAALGHDYTEYPDRAATCTEVGYEGYKVCSRCGVSEGKIIENGGHSMSAWKGNTATCTLGGIETSECANCDYKETRKTNALGHTYDAFGDCAVCSKRDIIVLVENGKANFNVVITSKATSSMASADSFVGTLRNLGIEINDVVRDSVASAVTEYEIIIGAGALNRGSACSITERDLGAEGTIVKMVGKKIIIAGATPALTLDAFDKFVKNNLGITSSTTELTYLEADSSCCYKNVTKYAVDSISIAGVDLSNYEYVLDVSGIGSYDVQDINAFHDALFKLSGYWLGYVSPMNMKENGKYFIVRYVDYAGDKGFRAYVDGDDFVVECAYKNMFNDAFRDFANTNFLFKSDSLIINSDFMYEKEVNVVYYEDFFAVGDGTTCDFEAIYNTHKFANEGGQKVMSKRGADATYYISPDKFTKTILVKTDVDFCGATFIVNDVGESAYKYRKLALFTLARDYTEVIIRDAELNVLQDYIDSTTGELKQKWVTDGIIDDERFSDVTFKAGETDFSWLKDVLIGEKNLVKIEDKLHKDFIRHGSNQNSGATRRDVFVVNADGIVESNILDAKYSYDKDNPTEFSSKAVFDYNNISTIEIYRADDKPITVQNGNFINICCRTVESTTYTANAADDDPHNDIVTKYANKFHEYQRGFIVNRTNATIKNVVHQMEKEPDLGWYLEGCGYTPDSKHFDNKGKIKYGSRHESYPYYGFIFANHTYNFTLEDTQLTGHTTYYEDKPATASTGGSIPEPVAMGTYDFVLEYSVNIMFKNVSQVNKPEQLASAKNGDYSYLTDTRYWGIMSSNGIKNIILDGCHINRFDAHRGFWNAALVDTYIGHSFQVIGGGILYTDNVTKAAKSNFMTFRGDYGATFEGDVIVNNSTLEARKIYNSWTQSSPNAVGSETTGYIMDSGYYAYNQGYSSAEDGYLGGYWYWDFGYTCYLPINVTIDGFKSSAKNTYVYDDLPDIIFTSTYKEGTTPGKFTVRYPYQITKTITQKNMKSAIPTCKGTWQRNTTNGYKDYPTYTYNELKSIPVTKINIG